MPGLANVYIDPAYGTYNYAVLGVAGGRDGS
jgi:hypothetical protein